jgi:hypothetical protein
VRLGRTGGRFESFIPDMSVLLSNDDVEFLHAVVLADYRENVPDMDKETKNEVANRLVRVRRLLLKEQRRTKEDYEVVVRVSINENEDYHGHKEMNSDTEDFVVSYMDERLYDMTRKEHPEPWTIVEVEKVSTED